MKNWIPTIALLALLLSPASGNSAALDPRFAEAERLYSEGSYKQAHDAYQKLAENLGNSEDRRWLEFRMAETLARAEAMSQNADDSTGRTAETALRKFVEDNARVDHIWAEAHEALGDISWFGRNRYNWHQGWPNYEKA